MKEQLDRNAIAHQQSQLLVADPSCDQNTDHRNSRHPTLCEPESHGLRLNSLNQTNCVEHPQQDNCDNAMRENTPSSACEDGTDVAKAVRLPGSTESSDLLGHVKSKVKHGRPPTARQIVEFATYPRCKLFQDQYGVAVAAIQKDDDPRCYECFHLKSEPFRAHLVKMLVHSFGDYPMPAELKKSLEILEMKCLTAQDVTLCVRHYQDCDKVVIDVGDDQRHEIEITHAGWNYQRQSDIRFIRRSHQRTLAIPVSGGHIDTLFEFITVDDEDDKLLIVTWMIAAMCARIITPMLLILGEQGSAKTTKTKWIRKLLDPSLLPVLGQFKSSQLFLSFHNHAVPCFENVSTFSDEVTDQFSRSVTGDGVERRQLYTNSNQVLYSFQRPIIINGIGLPTVQADFLDRCIMITCRRLPHFRSMQEMEERFAEAQPKLQGAMFDLLANVLGLLSASPGTSHFRMHDFARVGRAVAQSLGMEFSHFDDVYAENLKQIHAQVLDEMPMVRLLESFTMKYDESKPWQGSSQDLLDLLDSAANKTNDKIAKRDLPRTAGSLSSRLTKLSSVLITRNIVVTKLPRTNNLRPWMIYSSDVGRPNKSTARPLELT
ncbi:MAG: hypothetical protein ACKVT0_07470 [Planctomycetaceae bacterium]